MNAQTPEIKQLKQIKQFKTTIVLQEFKQQFNKSNNLPVFDWIRFLAQAHFHGKIINGDTKTYDSGQNAHHNYCLESVK